MHDIITKSLATTSSFFPSSDESTPTITKQRKQNTDSRPWSQQELPNINTDALENWQMRIQNETTPIQSAAPRRATPAGSLPKRSYPTRPDSGASIPMDKTTPTTRWLSNGNGQYIDPEATSWDLSENLVKLSIGDVGGAEDHVHAQMSTPPKSTMGSAAVVPLSESSPLETSSNPSVDSSPHPSDHQISISHSRGSSTDTTVSSSHESVVSGAGPVLLAPAPTKSGEIKERPHSFSGGLSAAELRRLQQVGEVDEHLQHQQWPSGAYRENGGVADKQYPPEQLPYPTLAHSNPTIHRPQPLQPFDYQTAQESYASLSNRDDLQIDYALQQRNYNPIQPSVMGALTPPGYVAARPANLQSLPFRQAPRNFPQQGLMHSPSFPSHTAHLSLGNTQQLYDMMMPPHETHPAVSRVQAQHNVFRATHHHSASDPSAITVLAALSGNTQGFPFQTAMAPPHTTMSMYPNQFYGAQETYPRGDVAAAQALVAARLQSQYTGQYPIVPPPAVGLEQALPSPTNSSNGPGGPSANNRKLGLYKTELCRSWEEKGSCRYGTKCQFAHGEEEIRQVSRHPKYKTEICRTFWVSGSCPYGKRCCFIHTEVPNNQAGAAGGTPTVDTAQQPPRPDGRARSMSTNSDPNDGSASLLARLKRNQEPNIASPSVEANPNSFQYTRPPTGSLRVDTSALDGPSLSKQNKSAYPTFTSNGILLPAGDHSGSKSPAPVTAGPDLGRHNLASRLEIVGYPHQLRSGVKNASSNSNVRRSLNGSDLDVSFSPSPPISGGQSSSYGLASAVEPPTNTGRIGGHVRAGSAGNWGLWSSSDLTVGSSRLNEKAWA